MSRRRKAPAGKRELQERGESLLLCGFPRHARGAAYDGYDSKKHSGIIAEFRRLYIKTGIFENGMSDMIRSLFDLRTDSDYNDFFVASKADVAEQVGNAEYFVQQIKEYLAIR